MNRRNSRALAHPSPLPLTVGALGEAGLRGSAGAFPPVRSFPCTLQTCHRRMRFGSAFETAYFGSSGFTENTSTCEYSYAFSRK
jgi:hypothetical protein